MEPIRQFPVLDHIKTKSRPQHGVSGSLSSTFLCRKPRSLQIWSFGSDTKKLRKDAEQEEKDGDKLTRCSGDTLTNSSPTCKYTPGTKLRTSGVDFPPNGWCVIFKHCCWGFDEPPVCATEDKTNFLLFAPRIKLLLLHFIVFI